MILFNTKKTPLIIDKSGRAISFLEEFLKESGYEKIDATRNDFITQVNKLFSNLKQ